MSDFRIRLNARKDGDTVLVKALLTHPMENGFNKTKDGKTIAAEYITEVWLALNGKEVASLHAGAGIAADPLFGWRLKEAKPGDTVRVSWRDNLGRERALETRVP